MPTRRQEIVRLLEQGPWTFDELREELGISVATLSEDLRHIERSVRGGSGGGSRRLRATAPRCEDCDFVLSPKPGRFTTPGRCPRCRSQRILPATLSI